MSSTMVTYSQGVAPPLAKDTVNIKTLAAAGDSIVIKSTDSSKVTKVSAQDVVAPSDTTVFGFALPTWLLNFIIGLVTVLPAIQVVLKRIPSEVSTKIGGILGSILDFLTFFQKDVVKKPDSTTNKT